MFGHSPKYYTSPLEKGDHPEMDASPELDLEGIKKHQSLIGSAQWAVSLGRFDIATAVMTMSAFRAAPREGHMGRVKRIIGYLAKMRHGALRYRTGRPDLSALPDQPNEWKNTPYGDAKEIIPHNAPKPLGKPVDTIHYFDANLLHDFISGKAVTATLTVLNKTVIDWYSKKQGTVESSTFTAEYLAGRTTTDQVIDMRNTLRYMGTPVGRTVVFGDNQSVITNSTIPQSQLQKRHAALSYHRVREAIAADIFQLYHINGDENPSDVLSKHWVTHKYGSYSNLSSSGMETPTNY